MKFVKDDYVRSRQRMYRVALYVSIVLVIGAALFIFVLKKTTKEVTPINQSGTVPPSDTVIITKVGDTDLPALVAKIRKSIVLIKTFDEKKNPIGTGTGFFINEKGHLVSNRHVVVGADGAEVQTASGIRPVRGVIAESSDYDLIKIAVEPVIPPAAGLKINEKLPRVGESVFVIGNPLGLLLGSEVTVSNGIVSSIRTLEPYGEIIQITCPISPGSSGSPVLNMKGEVIGVATFSINREVVENQNLNFAIPIARLKDLKEVQGKTLRDITVPDTEDPFGKGLMAFGRHEYQDALGYFRQAVKKDPRNAEAYYYVGICCVELKLTNAIEAFKKAVEIKPNYYQAYGQLGIAYIKLNMSTEAINALKKALEINSVYDDALLNLGIAYFQAKQYELAEKWLDKALRMRADAQGYFYLGYCYFQETQYDKAIQAARQSIAMSPNETPAYLLLAYCYGQEKDWQRGIEILNKAVIINPQQTEVHYLLGMMHLGNNDLESAEYESDLLRRLNAPSKLQNDLSAAISRYKYNKSSGQ
jgi:Flp pilus assembly protein TadD